MYKIEDIANYVVSFTIKQEKPITALKLQKILYFIQGFNYAKTNERFFDAKFEAWPYGPSNRDICIDYSIYGSFVIDTIIENNFNKNIISQKDKDFLNEIIPTLNSYSTYQLVYISKLPDSPWYKTYHEKGPKATINNILIFDYFKSQIKFKDDNIEEKISDKNVENLYNIMLNDEDQILQGAQWENMYIDDYSDPLSIIEDFTEIFYNTDFQQYDTEIKDFVSISTKKERKKALIKFFENRIDKLRKE